MYNPYYISKVYPQNKIPFFYEDVYLCLLTLIVFLVLVAIVIIIIVIVFNNRFWLFSQTNSVYECGFLPLEEAHIRFEPKFYMIALSFIIFDLEICFIFPWLITFTHFLFLPLFYFLFFLSLILFGIVYEWKIGIFDWNLINKTN